MDRRDSASTPNSLSDHPIVGENSLSLDGDLPRFHGTPLSPLEHLAMTDLETAFGASIPVIPFDHFFDFFNPAMLETEAALGSATENRFRVKRGCCIVQGHVFALQLYPEPPANLDPVRDSHLLHAEKRITPNNREVIIEIPMPWERYIEFPESAVHLSFLQYFNDTRFISWEREFPTPATVAQFAYASNDYSALPPRERRALLEILYNAFSEVDQGVEFSITAGHVDTIRFFRCKLYEIPRCIYHLEHLISFSIESGNMITFPPQMGELRLLTKINIERNESMFGLPKSICECPSLEILEIEDTQLNEIPPEIGQLKHLKQLKLSNCHIRMLPPEIAQMERLEELDIGNTYISTLPNEICNLKNLRSLCMATKENIEEIYLPECMLKMENLNEIYPKDGWDKLKGFEHAFQTIIDKIESNRPLHPLEQVHPKLSQWAPLIEKKCFEKLSNIVEEERPNSTAAAVLALFEEKGFIKLDVSGDKMPLWK